MDVAPHPVALARRGGGEGGGGGGDASSRFAAGRAMSSGVRGERGGRRGRGRGRGGEMGEEGGEREGGERKGRGEGREKRRREKKREGGGRKEGGGGGGGEGGEGGRRGRGRGVEGREGRGGGGEMREGWLIWEERGGVAGERERRETILRDGKFPDGNFRDEERSCRLADVCGARQVSAPGAASEPRRGVRIGGETRLSAQYIERVDA